MCSNMMSAADAADDETHEEIVEEMREECSKHGSVVRIHAPRPLPGTSLPQDQEPAKIFVEMATEAAAQAVLLSLSGRSFDGRIVEVKFFPHTRTTPDGLPDPSYTPTAAVVTALGPLTAEIVNTPPNQQAAPIPAPPSYPAPPLSISGSHYLSCKYYAKLSPAQRL